LPRNAQKQNRHWIFCRFFGKNFSARAFEKSFYSAFELEVTAAAGGPSNLPVGIYELISCLFFVQLHWLLPKVPSEKSPRLTGSGSKSGVAR
jgi:hypothetical protein